MLFLKRFLVLDTLASEADFDEGQQPELVSRSSLPPLRFDKPIGKQYEPSSVVDDFLQFDQQQTSLLEHAPEQQAETQDNDDDDPFSL